MIQRGDETDRPNDNSDKNHNPVLVKEAWDFSARSDKEILHNTTYKFNLPVKKLINNSNDTRLAKRNKKNGTNIIPRRQNAWIIYRRDKCVSPEFYGLKSAFISKKIGRMWEAEPEEIKELFEILKKMSDNIHNKKYEGYVYKPRPPKRRPKKKIQKKKATNAGLAHNLHLHVFSAFEKAPAASSSSVLPVTYYPPSPFSLVDEELPSNTLETEVGSTILPPTPTESNLDSPIFPATTSPATITTITEESNALGLITPNLNSLPTVTSNALGLITPNLNSNTCSPDPTHTTIVHFFPEPSMIIPLTLEYEHNLLVDARNNFFSTPCMTPFLEEIGPVCDLSQTNNNRQYGDDWVLYPADQIDNPREIEDSQFSDYISH